jgi:L-malate glycosyltransferase
MQEILHIGNKLEGHGRAPTLVDTLPDKLQAAGLSVRSVSDYKNKPLRLLHILWNVIKVKRSEIILIDTYSTANFWFAILAGFISKIKHQRYVFVLHGGNLPARLKNSPGFILNLFKNAFAVVIPSAYLLHTTKKFNWSNTVFIPNSINIQKYSFKLRNKVGPRLLWVRAFAEVYNPSLAIECLKILLQTYPDAELCMIGPDKDGSLHRMKDVAQKSSLPVKFPGKLSKKEWIGLSANYDIFINTTNVDNTPVSVIEAMALGLPVVSTNVGGMPYLLDHGNTGILVERNNAKEMASAIKFLLENSDRANTISNKARLKVENFDWEKVKPLWLDLLA